MHGPNTFTNKIISPDIVRGFREKLGMTQAQLADDAKMTENQVKSYEDGAPTNILVVHEIGSALERRGIEFPKPR